VLTENLNTTKGWLLIDLLFLQQVGDVDERGRHLLGSLKGCASEKLDVEDLVEMDRALQAINWVEAVRSIGKQLDDIW